MLPPEKEKKRTIWNLCEKERKRERRKKEERENEEEEEEEEGGRPGLDGQQAWLVIRRANLMDQKRGE